MCKKLKVTTIKEKLLLLGTAFWVYICLVCLIYSMFNCLIDLIWNEWSYKYTSLSTLGVICLVCISRPMIQRFVAAGFGVVAERATLLHNKLHSNVAQQKSRVSLS